MKSTETTKAGTERVDQSDSRWADQGPQTLESIQLRLAELVASEIDGGLTEEAASVILDTIGSVSALDEDEDTDV